jgi:nucleotide-binding universal stress UspA family protein
VEEGNIVDMVLDIAQTHNADMIVLGNHTHSGRHSHITPQIVRDAKVPVLVVPNE